MSFHSLSCAAATPLKASGTSSRWPTSSLPSDAMAAITLARTSGETRGCAAKACGV